MKEVVKSRRFERQLSRALGHEVSLDDMEHLTYFLQKGEPLPPEYHEHQLTDNWEGYTECHLTGDLVVIYKISATRVSLFVIGTHTELFSHRKRKRPTLRGWPRWPFGP
jgi:mRNA interferase YafQ